MRRVAFYGMGGGFGHGVRCLAVARRLPGEVRLWAPERLRLFAEACGVPLDSPPEEPRPTRETLGAWVRQRLQAFRPDLLVVDVFPRGVLGEIPPDGPPRVLLTRYVKPGFYESPGPAEALRGYLAFLASEVPVALQRRVHRVQPITLATHLRPREEARRRLGGDRPRVLVLGTGPWQFAVQAVLRNVTVRLAGALGLAPAGEWLLGADAVVAAGGYGSYHEVARSGVPAVFLPQERPVDDQRRRALGLLGAVPSGPWRVARAPEEVPGLLQEALGEPAGPVQDWDGAAEAAAFLSAC